jgi:hypothetical protein
MQTQTSLLFVHTLDFQALGRSSDLGWITFLLEDINNLMRNEGAVATTTQARRLRDARREVRNA